MRKYPLSWWLVVAHTALVLLTFGAMWLPSDNPDSSIGFMLMVIVGYIIDFPIGMLFERIGRSMDMGIFTHYIIWMFCYLFLGGVYWFFIGTGISKIYRASRRRHRNRR